MSGMEKPENSEMRISSLSIFSRTNDSNYPDSPASS